MPAIATPALRPGGWRARVPLGLLSTVVLLQIWKWGFAGHYRIAYIVLVLLTVPAVFIGCVLTVPRFIAAVVRRHPARREIAAPLMLSGAFALWLFSGLYPPDFAMAWRFRAQHTAFAALGQMLHDDLSAGRLSGAALAPDSESQEPVRLAPARQTRYRALIERLGLPFGIYGKGDSLAVLQVENWGLAGDWNAKGYAYALVPIRDTLPSLDRGVGGYRRYRFRHLAGPWYLFDYRS